MPKRSEKRRESISSATFSFMLIRLISFRDLVSKTARSPVLALETRTREPSGVNLTRMGNDGQGNSAMRLSDSVSMILMESPPRFATHSCFPSGEMSRPSVPSPVMISVMN